MTAQLREELQALAETQAFSPDPTAWDRGRRARRRTQVARGAVVLAVLAVIVGAGTIATRPSAVGPADDVVPEGAIPSRIDDTDTGAPGETDFAIGRASVAFVSTSTQRPTVIGASDGRPHHLEMSPPLALALSPDGEHLAVAMPDELQVIDLETGDVLEHPINGTTGARIDALLWRDDVTVAWRGVADGTQTEVAAALDTTGPLEWPSDVAADRPEVLGIPSPDQGITAIPSDGTVRSAPFVRQDPSGADRSVRLVRRLPADLYPDGATVRPLGWTQPHLLLAEVDAPAGSYVEGPHLALFTSPDRPEAEWTYRVVMREVPDVQDLSVAADLVPDLDGTSSQQLTHDFTEDSVNPLALTTYEMVLPALFLVALVLGGVVLVVGWRRRRSAKIS